MYHLVYTKISSLRSLTWKNVFSASPAGIMGGIPNLSAIIFLRTRRSVTVCKEIWAYIIFSGAVIICNSEPEDLIVGTLLLGPRDTFGVLWAIKCNYLNDDFNWDHDIKQALKWSGTRAQCPTLKSMVDHMKDQEIWHRVLATKSSIGHICL